MNLFLLFLRNLAVTAAVEGLAVGVVRRDKRFVGYSLLCNLLTNPAANLLVLLAVLLLGGEAYVPALALVECIVVGVEAVVYRLLGQISKRRALWLSLLVNALSFLAGLLLDLIW